jgi:hypothetical protein
MTKTEAITRILAETQDPACTSDRRKKLLAAGRRLSTGFATAETARKHMEEICLLLK